jgi:hypothetical protein
MSAEISRREFVKGSVLASAGAAMAAGLAGYGSAAEAPVATSGQAAAPDHLQTIAAGTWTGKIRGLELSRLMLGGNLISGYAHSRDLGYVGNLMCHYNTPEKIVETLEIAVGHGVNSVNTTAWDDITPIQTYWAKYGEKIKWVVSVRPYPMEDNPYREIDEVVKKGAHMMYLWGGASDGMVKTAKGMDQLKRMVDRMRAAGRPIGIGAHTLGVIVACEKAKIDVDFYQKTLHTQDYPSAQKPEETAEFGSYDNAWCRNSAEVIEVMKNVQKPWIAFKVMAAGAIKPRKAFQYSFDGGADFMLAGMFDFQIAQDVQITKEVLAKLNRTRPWRG